MNPNIEQGSQQQPFCQLQEMQKLVSSSSGSSRLKVKLYICQAVWKVVYIYTQLDSFMSNQKGEIQLV